MSINLRAIKILIKLLPSIIALRKDRRKWASATRNNKTSSRDNIATTIDTASFQSHARRMLDTFVSLGPVYIKLGQWLSSRADILPHPYLEELAQLQDNVPAAPFDMVRPTLEKNLGPLQETFDDINKESISGASLGQVYRATYDGKQVAIKVKRPGIEKVVSLDLAVLKKILPLALRFVDPNLRYSAKAMLSQFIESIHEEMDYTAESANLKKIKQDMETSNRTVVIPSVYDELSSKDVLTMQYIPGIKVTNIKSLDEMGIDRKKLVINVHKVFFTMLLRHSIFHADPHPGNISVTDQGQLILYDYGMVGRLDNETRMRLVRLYLALVEKDPSRTVNAMDDLGMLVPDFNRDILEKGIDMTIQAMYGRKPDDMAVDSLMELANRTMSRFPFILPKNLALYMRMASIIEGIYKTHEVEFKFVRVLREILEEEQLIKDAYVEEIKHSITRFVKSIDATIAIAPELKKHLEEVRAARHLSQGRINSGMILLSGAIFSGLLFTGSAILHSAVTVDSTATITGSIGIIGMITSFVAMGVFAIFAKRRR